MLLILNSGDGYLCCSGASQCELLVLVPGAQHSVAGEKTICFLLGLKRFALPQVFSFVV